MIIIDSRILQICSYPDEFMVLSDFPSVSLVRCRRLGDLLVSSLSCFRLFFKRERWEKATNTRRCRHWCESAATTDDPGSEISAVSSAMDHPRTDDEGEIQPTAAPRLSASRRALSTLRRAFRFLPWFFSVIATDIIYRYRYFIFSIHYNV